MIIRSLLVVATVGVATLTAHPAFARRTWFRRSTANCPNGQCAVPVTPVAKPAEEATQAAPAASPQTTDCPNGQCNVTSVATRSSRTIGWRVFRNRR